MKKCNNILFYPAGRFPFVGGGGGDREWFLNKAMLSE